MKKIQKLPITMIENNYTGLYRHICDFGSLSLKKSFKEEVIKQNFLKAIKNSQLGFRFSIYVL